MIYIILLAVLSAIAVSYCYLLKPNISRKEKMKPFEDVLIAHRGLFDNRSVPENSLTAFFRADEAGYGIELDVRLTADNKLAVFHDASLKRMCGIKKKVEECTYEELQRYQLLGTDEKIPLFDDVLEVIGERTPLIIEIKTAGRSAKISAALAAELADYNGIFCVESFDPMAVRWFSKYKPEVMRGLLSTNHRKAAGKKSVLSGLLITSLLFNRYAEPDFIAYNFEYSSDPAFKLCRRLYDPVCAAWTVRNNETLEFVRSDFDIIIFDSFYPRSQN